MSFTESVKTVLFQKYATFKGRASRSEYWWFTLFYALLGLISLISEILNAVISLLILIPTIAVMVRRIHDTNNSGFLLLGPIGFFAVGGGILGAGGVNFGGFVLILGVIFYLYIFYLMIKKGDESENQYGPNPLTEESTEAQVAETVGKSAKVDLDSMTVNELKDLAAKAIDKSAEVDLNSMTVNELKDLAAEKGVKILSKDTKAVIIQKLSE